MFENFTSLASHDWKGRIIYQNYKYCFQPLNNWQLMEDGRWYYTRPLLQEEYENLEIVARGIVSQYIRYEQEKSPKEIFADYYKGCFQTFKGNRKNDIELMLKSDKDIEVAFVETMIDEEKWRIAYSEKGIERFSDYFSDEERGILKQVERGFIGYLQDRLKELKQDNGNQSGEKEGSKSNYIVNIEVLKVLPNLYAFLVKKKVINESQISCTDYTTAIEKADISSIYPDSVKYKFKTTIKAIQKCFTEDWLKAICKSAGISEDSMGKWNFSDNTAKQLWFRELDMIVKDL